MTHRRVVAGQHRARPRIVVLDQRCAARPSGQNHVRRLPRPEVPHRHPYASPERAVKGQEAREQRPVRAAVHLHAGRGPAPAPTITSARPSPFTSPAATNTPRRASDANGRKSPSGPVRRSPVDPSNTRTRPASGLDPGPAPATMSGVPSPFKSPTPPAPPRGTRRQTPGTASARSPRGRTHGPPAGRPPPLPSPRTRSATNAAPAPETPASSPAAPVVASRSHPHVEASAHRTSGLRQTDDNTRATDRRGWPPQRFRPSPTPRLTEASIY